MKRAAARVIARRGRKRIRNIANNVGPAGDDVAPPREERPKADARASVGRHEGEAAERGDLVPRDVHELGRRRAGVQAAHVHRRAAQLERERLGEVADVGLPGAVRRVRRHGRVGADRGDVEDPPAAALEHGADEPVSEFGQRHDVELQLRRRSLPRDVGEAVVHAEPGVVHEDVHGAAGALGRLEEPLGRPRLAEVHRDDVGADPVPRPDRARERLQLVVPPRHEDHVGPTRRELPRDCLADAARCARDERGLPGQVPTTHVRLPASCLCDAHCSRPVALETAGGVGRRQSETRKREGRCQSETRGEGKKIKRSEDQKKVLGVGRFLPHPLPDLLFF